MQTIKNIIVADDHAMILEGLISQLNKLGFNVIASASDFDQLISLLDTHTPDCIISDCHMPGIGAIEFLKHSKDRFPELSVAFLTGLESALLFEQLLAFKTNALISKKDSLKDISHAIASINRKQTFISDAIQRAIEYSPSKLTAKEFEVLMQITKGKSNNEIAEYLGLSASTIDTHRRRIMKKLNVNTVVDLIHTCEKSGLLE